MADYPSLRVWQRAHELTLEVYHATSGFPRSEAYGLTSQIRRSAASVPANLAEGTGRGTQAELARFCRMALGSLNELEYQLFLSRDLEFLAGSQHAAFAASISELRRMLTRFIQAL